MGNVTSSKKPDETEDFDQTDLVSDPEKTDDVDDPLQEASSEEIEEGQPNEADDTTDESDLSDEPMLLDEPVAEENDTSEETEAETDTPTQAEEVPAAPVAASTEAPSTGGGFLPTLLGGVLAAGLGFGVSQFLMDTSADTSDLEQAVDSQTNQVAALRKAVVALQNADAPEIPDIETPLNALSGELTAAISALSDDVSDLSMQLGALETRLSDVEKRPVSATDTTGAVAAYERELTEIREALAEQQAKNAEMTEQVAAAAEAAKAEIGSASARARAVEAQAAIQSVQSALDTGTSFAASLAALPGDLPEALTVPSETGVATLPELQSSFDEYARQALSASLKEAPGENTQDRIGSFLRSQLNIRSLRPREGDDADAILSRAQGALSANDLAGTLSEISQLPESGQAAMADWTAMAKARLEAKAAIETLAQSLNQN